MNSASLLVRFKCLVVLIILMVVDIGPVPVTAMFALFVVLLRPKWFKEITGLIYAR